jgi:hypothetical protein
MEGITMKNKLENIAEKIKADFNINYFELKEDSYFDGVLAYHNNIEQPMSNKLRDRILNDLEQSFNEKYKFYPPMTLCDPPSEEKVYYVFKKII